MSSYMRKARNPKTSEIETAWFLDDYFGPHQYGVQFADGGTYSPDDIEVVD